MVTVRFLNLLRSKYHIEELKVNPGTLEEIIDEIIHQVPMMSKKDFEHAAIFVNQQRIIHINWISETIHDGDFLVFTHFVGGG